MLPTPAAVNTLPPDALLRGGGSLQQKSRNLAARVSNEAPDVVGNERFHCIVGNDSTSSGEQITASQRVCMTARNYGGPVLANAGSVRGPRCNDALMLSLEERLTIAKFVPVMATLGLRFCQ